MDTSILRKIGLDEKEISIYITLLRLGNTTASMISKETSIDRATCYRYIDSLINKGLISYSIKNNVKYFTPSHPDKILKDLKEKESEYKKLIPELVNISNISKQDTTAEVYKGKEGLKTVLREVLRTKKDHLVLGDEGHYQELLPIFFHHFLQDCEKNKIKEKVLCSQEVFKKIKQFDYKFSKTKALPSGSSLPTTTLVYGEKIVLFSWEEPYNAIVITNKNLAESYRKYFEMLWKLARK